MKKIVIMSLGFLSVFFFYGCAGSSYSISASGDKNSDIAFIKFSDTCTYQINDVIKYKESQKVSNGLEGRTTKVKILSRSNCNNITYMNWKIINSNMWYIDSITDALLASKDNCQIESSINGINFLKCNQGYRIASSKVKDDGYDNRNLIYAPKECYESIKNQVNNCQNNTQSYTSNKESIKKVESKSSVISYKMSNLKKLYKDGLITEDEYINKKKQLLDNY